MSGRPAGHGHAFERLISLELDNQVTSGNLCSMSPFHKFRIWRTPIPTGAATARGTCRVRGFRRHSTLGNATMAGPIAFKFGVCSLRKSFLLVSSFLFQSKSSKIWQSSLFVLLKIFEYLLIIRHLEHYEVSKASFRRVLECRRVLEASLEYARVFRERDFGHGSSGQRGIGQDSIGHGSSNQSSGFGQEAWIRELGWRMLGLCKVTG